MNDFSVRPLQPGDIASLEPVLREHICDLNTGEVVESEINLVLGYMRGGLDSAGRLRLYYVACDIFGNAFACMAISAPDTFMSTHFGTNITESVELLNAFVRSDRMRGQGIGRALFNAICMHGRTNNARYLLVNSGPRYKTSWDFYDRIFDSAHGFIENYYGPARHAKTWKKDLQLIS